MHCLIVDDLGMILDELFAGSCCGLCEVVMVVLGSALGGRKVARRWPEVGCPNCPKTGQFRSCFRPFSGLAEGGPTGRVSCTTGRVWFWFGELFFVA